MRPARTDRAANVALVMARYERSLEAALADARLHLSWAEHKTPIALGVLSGLRYLHSTQLVRWPILSPPATRRAPQLTISTPACH